MAFDELLADRVRTCLRHVAGVSERTMSGGLAFMIGSHLTAGVYNDGLIARIGAQDRTWTRRPSSRVCGPSI
jgi:hypothetical protein